MDIEIATSPFLSALARLDDSLATVQSQVARLRAALEVSDDQLSHSLLDARQQMATLRELIRAERPDASWNDRRTLEHLIDELEISAKVRRNQQRRTKLEELANELQVGRVQHRFDTRTSALNKLRMEAVEELRTEAAISDQVKDLPGPSASAWLHWACNLQDANDALDLTNLRKDFKAAERFAVEMEERYWFPGQPIYGSPSEPAEQPVRPEQEPTAYSVASPTSGPFAVLGGDQGEVVERANTRTDKATQSESHMEAPLPASEQLSGEALSSAEVVVPPQTATQWQPATITGEADPGDVQTAAAPNLKYCDQCHSNYPSAFNVCPIDGSVLRITSETTTCEGYPVPGGLGEESVGLSDPGDSQRSSPLTMGTELPLDPADLQPAELPSVDPSLKVKEADWLALQRTLNWRFAAAEQAPASIGERMRQKLGSLRGL